MPEVGQYHDAWTDRRGNWQRSITTTVYEADGTTPATLYDGQDGATALANPLPTGVAQGSAGEDTAGNLIFFAVPGPYVLVGVRSGSEVGRTPIVVNVDTPGGGVGDVVGPGSSVDDNVVTFDGVTGKLIQDSGTAISDLVTDAELAAATSVFECIWLYRTNQNLSTFTTGLPANLAVVLDGQTNAAEDGLYLSDGANGGTFQYAIKTVANVSKLVVAAYVPDARSGEDDTLFSSHEPDLPAGIDESRTKQVFQVYTADAVTFTLESPLFGYSALSEALDEWFSPAMGFVSATSDTELSIMDGIVRGDTSSNDVEITLGPIRGLPRIAVIGHHVTGNALTVVNHADDDAFSETIPDGEWWLLVTIPTGWTYFVLPEGAGIHRDVDGEIAALTAKATPTTSDFLLIEDAAASNAKKSITIGDLQTDPPGSPNGFEDRTDCTLSWVDGTRTLTLTGNFTIWSNGTKYDITGPDSIQIGDVEGEHFIYYDSAGTLQEIASFDPDLIFADCYVALIVWDAVNSEAVPGAINEQHGISMSPATHSYLHNTVSTAYDSGLALTVTSVDGTGNDADNARFSSAVGQMRDEDINHSITAHGSTDAIPVLYRSGATGLWRMDDDAEYPVLKGASRAQWNEWTGATWQLTEVANNDFVLAHIYSIPGVTPTTGYLVAVIGQADYGTLPAARAGALVELLALDLAGLPSPEFLPVATLIFQTGNGYANAVASRTRTTDAGDDYIDWRNAAIGTGGSGSTTVAWGDVTGTLANQTDLQAELDTAIHDDVASEISAVTAKATPTTSDFLLIEDAAASNAKKSITIGDLPSAGGGSTPGLMPPTLPGPVIPGIRGVGSRGTLAWSGNRTLNYYPIVVTESIDVTALNCYVSSAGSTGSLHKLGLYEADDFYSPNGRLETSGDIDGESTGAKTYAFTSRTLTAGIYMQAFNTNTAAVTTAPTLMGLDMGVPFIAGDQFFAVKDIRTTAAACTMPDPATAPDSIGSGANDRFYYHVWLTTTGVA